MRRLRLRVPITGDNYVYVYCLWVTGADKGKGTAKADGVLPGRCRAKGKSGVCMLGAKKQKHWLADQTFAKRFGI